ncbi:hypothetical protein KC342_g18313 [Hortaea werneckii]|nr:hypothetical protein KC342_g18313 [Hortaea werneckii]
MAEGNAYNEILLNLRLGSKYSDLTIVCGSFEAKVHKCIVCPQSEFFEKACETGRWKEGDTGVIELRPASHYGDDAIAEDDPEAVRLMIDYFYLGDYDPEVITKDPSISATDENGGFQKALDYVTVNDTSMEPQEDCKPRLDSHNTNPAADQPEDAALSLKKKKRKGKAKHVKDVCSPPLDPHTGIEESASSPVRRLLATHAKMYSIAAKYNIETLMDIAVMKFRSAAKGIWDVQDLIAAVPIVYTQIPECENTMRDVVEKMILEHAYKLVPEPGFKEAVEKVHGLTFGLFKRLGAVTRQQKVCRCCGAAYISICAIEGCRPAPFGGYGHDCDLKGPCRDCRRGN